MKDVLMWVLALIGVISVVVTWFAIYAPEGYQDRDGFHLGRPEKEDEA